MPQSRPTQARSKRNDGRLLDAALAIADDTGWAGMALAPIAQRAGLSRQAAVSRYRDRSDLGADLWTKEAGPHLSAALTSLIAAVRHPGDEPDLHALRAAFRTFVEPDLPMRAAAELLLVGRYDPAVKAAVQATLSPSLDEWLTPAGRRLTPAKAARHGYALTQALGLLMQARRFPIAAGDLDSELDLLGRALTMPVSPRKLPARSLEHLDRPVEFGTGDPEWELLLRATLDEVGRLGYEAATLDVIARAAGCTQGLIYARYRSKQELFFDASDRMGEAAVNANNDFWREVAESRSQGIAQATLMREFMMPGRESQRTVQLEQLRLSWHDPDLQANLEKNFADAVWQISNDDPGRSVTDLRAYVYVGMAQGYGVTTLADLHPTAWKLPYDVVAVPIFDLQ